MCFSLGESRSLCQRNGFLLLLYAAVGLTLMLLVPLRRCSRCLATKRLEGTHGATKQTPKKKINAQ